MIVTHTCKTCKTLHLALDLRALDDVAAGLIAPGISSSNSIKTAGCSQPAGYLEIRSFLQRCVVL